MTATPMTATSPRSAEFFDRQMRHPGWDQGAASSGHVVVVSRPCTAAERLVEVLTAAGVGRIEIATTDVGWALELVDRCADLAPVSQISPLDLGSALSVPPVPGALVIELAQPGEAAARHLGGDGPDHLISLHPSFSGLDAAIEAATRALRDLGVCQELESCDVTERAPHELAPDPKTEPSPPFALFIVGAGALTNGLLVAMAHHASTRPHRLAMCDGDTVSTSNLNRQLLFRVGDRGRPKATVLAERVPDLLGTADVVAHDHHFWTADLAAFVATARAAGERVVVAHLTDTWASRQEAMEAATLLGVDAQLYAGTHFTGGRARLFGPSVPDSWCAACGTEQLLTRVAVEAAEVARRRQSCSQRHDAAMLLPNLAVGRVAVELLHGWLTSSVELPGAELDLAAVPRRRSGGLCRPCSHARGQHPQTGTLEWPSGAQVPVIEGAVTPFGKGLAVAGATLADGRHGALLLLGDGITGGHLLGGTPEAGVMALADGDRRQVDGHTLTFRRRSFRLRAPAQPAGRCAWCLDPLDGGWVTVCADDHVVCERCSESSCPRCGNADD